jgi:hypothetical protein
MNTIAPPPKINKLPPSKRILGVFIGLVGAGATNLALGYAGFSFYSRRTQFVPYDADHDDLKTAVFKELNPAGNPPVCIDHAVKTIPLSQLKTTDQARLTTEFCRGVWSGLGYAYQRRYLEKKYRALEGRQNHLWDRKDLAESDYQVGTKITDHFEVMEHSPEKVHILFQDTLWYMTLMVAFLGHCALRRQPNEHGSPPQRWPFFYGSNQGRGGANSHLPSQKRVCEYDAWRKGGGTSTMEIPVRASTVHQAVDGDGNPQVIEMRLGRASGGHMITESIKALLGMVEQVSLYGLIRTRCCLSASSRSVPRLQRVPFGGVFIHLHN